LRQKPVRLPGTRRGFHCDKTASSFQGRIATENRPTSGNKAIGHCDKPSDCNQKSATITAEGNQESTTTITSTDPQAEMVPLIVAWISRGWIKPSSDDVVLLRLLGLTVPPALAGLFLMFATALLAPPRAT